MVHLETLSKLQIELFHTYAYPYTHCRRSLRLPAMGIVRLLILITKWDPVIRFFFFSCHRC
jgi:hypothetical protein